ncbi:hypothetical protein R3P38DRAFT_3166285 [Favolaschia claudopus]|uniref:Uncharacterized protein n=1 Tax=Favolaschia claudopus TaxID=2862362 RepID=A0AAW0E7S6_9AGAR
MTIDDFNDDDYYEFTPPTPEKQHARLVAPHQLTAAGIPCILWGEDALQFVHRVATHLFDQQILVPDELLESAAATLQNELTAGTLDYPKAIRLRHKDLAPEDMVDSSYVLHPLPSHVLLLPQSYYGINLPNERSRFRSMVPPNESILVPEFHTFIEGLVHFIVNPPIPQQTGAEKHRIYIGYLCSWRVQYDSRNLPPVGVLLPEEEKILGELETEDACWYISCKFLSRRLIEEKQIVEYKQEKLAATNKTHEHHELAKIHGENHKASFVPHLSLFQGVNGHRAPSSSMSQSSYRDGPNCYCVSIPASFASVPGMMSEAVKR